MVTGSKQRIGGDFIMAVVREEDYVFVIDCLWR
jgi:hypothetical protein